MLMAKKPVNCFALRLVSPAFHSDAHLELIFGKIPTHFRRRLDTPLLFPACCSKPKQQGLGGRIRGSATWCMFASSHVGSEILELSNISPTIFSDFLGPQSQTKACSFAA